MTSYTINRIHAVSVDAPKLAYVPNNLNPNTLVDVLRRLNLMVPTGLAVAASSGGSLRASGHAYTIREVDAALARTELGIGDRLKIKAAMDRNGILKQ
ncbi:hypothetical protein ACQR18_26275 [Bradyrhizobium oligotrophicum]|uniref:hypothetical protein n=1 Tax=Bradyrhizobium oligotrophicum TaxID=44255 RepID=UPI003EBE96A1